MTRNILSEVRNYLTKFGKKKKPDPESNQIAFAHMEPIQWGKNQWHHCLFSH